MSERDFKCETIMMSPPADLSLSALDRAMALIDEVDPEAGGRYVVCGHGVEDVLRAMWNHAPRVSFFHAPNGLLTTPHSWALVARRLDPEDQAGPIREISVISVMPS